MIDLRELVAAPARVAELSREESAALLVELATLQAALAASLRYDRETPRAEHSTEERLLTPQEAAGLLGVKVRWLYDHAHQLACTRRLSRKVLRFHEPELRKMLRKRA